MPAGCIDVVRLMCHGFAVTPLDALCHFFTPEGKQGMYNGYPIDAVMPKGALKLGIEHVGKTGIVGRGVLLDVAGIRGGPLSLGSTIRPADLEAAEKEHALRVEEGDIVFIRNGGAISNTHKLGTGLHASCLPCSRARRVRSEQRFRQRRSSSPANLLRWVEPIHMVGIPYMGLTLLDNADLDGLAEACAAEKRWTFFVSVAPWRLKGATGSAVDLLAMF
jgi:hypothetical protein